jgi:hypothetical protein
MNKPFYYSDSTLLNDQLVSQYSKYQTVQLDHNPRPTQTIYVVLANAAADYLISE